MPHQCTNCGRSFPDGSKEMLSGCPDCGGNKFQFSPAPPGDEPAAGSESSTPPDSSHPSDSDVRTDTSSPSTAPQTQTESSSVTPTQSPPTSSGSQTDSSLTADFPEWPDTARRPEDRSTASVTTASDENTEQPRGDEHSPPADDDDDAHARVTRNESPADSDQPLTADENDAQASARSDVVSKEELPTEFEPSQQAPSNGRVVSEPSGAQPSLEELREELNEQFESIKILKPGQYELNLMELYNRDEYIISLQEDGRYVIDVPESWHATE